MNKVIAVFSPTGGIGVSTVAAHLAYQLANEAETAIVDMNPDFGSIGQILHFSPTLPQDKYPVAMRADSPFIKQLSHPQHSRLKFFPSPPSTVLDSIDWKNHVDNCRRLFQYTILDLPHTFLLQELFVGLELCDLIALVCEYKWASILNARYFLDSSHEGISSKIKIVMNKYEWLPKDVIAESIKNLGMSPISDLPLVPGLAGTHKIEIFSVFGGSLKSLTDKLKQELKPS